MFAHCEDKRMEDWDQFVDSKANSETIERREGKRASTSIEKWTYQNKRVHWIWMGEIINEVSCRQVNQELFTLLGCFRLNVNTHERTCTLAPGKQMLIRLCCKRLSSPPPTSFRSINETRTNQYKWKWACTIYIINLINRYRYMHAIILHQ